MVVLFMTCLRPYLLRRGGRCPLNTSVLRLARQDAGRVLPEFNAVLQGAFSRAFASRVGLIVGRWFTGAVPRQGWPVDSADVPRVYRELRRQESTSDAPR